MGINKEEKVAVSEFPTLDSLREVGEAGEKGGKVTLRKEEVALF